MFHTEIPYILPLEGFHVFLIVRVHFFGDNKPHFSLMEKECIYCSVRTEYLNIIQVKLWLKIVKFFSSILLHIFHYILQQFYSLTVQSLFSFSLNI